MIFSIRLVVILMGLLVAAATCHPLSIDRSFSASSSGDLTLQLQGGGAVSRKGYLFIQLNEGAPVGQPLALIVPLTDCNRAACISYAFFHKDGSVSLTGGILKGQSRLDFSLMALLGHDGTIAFEDAGEYSGVIQVFYVVDGVEKSTLMNGFIRLNVLASGYSPVGCNDPAIGWKTQLASNCEVQFTTSGRSVACGSGCEL